MQRRLRTGVGIGLGLVWFGLVLSLPAPQRQPAALPLLPLERPVRRVGRRTPSAASLWQARWYRTRAIQAANQARYPILESLPLAAAKEADTEGWRRQLMASDSTGDLRRALRWARKAVALARTPAEECQARQWRALIASEAGYYGEARQQARRLVELQPQDPLSWALLRRSAGPRSRG